MLRMELCDWTRVPVGQRFYFQPLASINSDAVHGYKFSERGFSFIFKLHFGEANGGSMQKLHSSIGQRLVN